MADDDVKEAMEKNAQEPKSASGDVGSVKQHSLKDQREVDRYLQSRRVRNNPFGAVRFAKVNPEGTT